MTQHSNRGYSGDHSCDVGVAELDPAPTAAGDLIPRLTRYMQDYPMLRRMYSRVTETGKASADLIVDGTPAAEDIADQIRTALAGRDISP